MNIETIIDKDAAQRVARTVYEEVLVGADELGQQLQNLIREGRVRQLQIKQQNGQVLLELPLPIAAAMATLLAVFMPIRWVLVVLLAALFARVYLVVERYDDTPGWARDVSNKIPM